uniref:Uncharacterized protein n=1 Tax=Arundo donax TaxID=35708 RepID=A0A0A9G9B0_ARUDO
MEDAQNLFLSSESNCENFLLIWIYLQKLNVE